MTASAAEAEIGLETLPRHHKEKLTHVLERGSNFFACPYPFNQREGSLVFSIIRNGVRMNQDIGVNKPRLTVHKAPLASYRATCPHEEPFGGGRSAAARSPRLESGQVA